MIHKQEPQKEQGNEWDDFDQATEHMSSVVIASTLPSLHEPVPAPALPPATKDVPQVRARRSPIPIVVGSLLLIIQMVLLIRFALKTFMVPPERLLVQMIYTVSTIFAQPFYTLGQLIPISFPQETYTLLALLVYGLVARVLVRFLKALLNAD